jgi:phage/plasmid-associated DNA primase
MSDERNGRGPDKKPRAQPLREISTELLLRFYDALLRSDKVSEVAAEMETSIPVLLSWVKRFPELKLAKEMATRKKKETSSLDAYIYQQLSEETKKLWDELMESEGPEKQDDKSGFKFRKVLQGVTKTQRQEIYLHALVYCKWNSSKACRYACVSVQTLESWIQQDRKFGALVAEMEVHRKNFFESALVAHTENGNASVCMFVNRTLNADRGYNERIAIDHNHSGTVNHVFHRAKDLNLNLEARKEILRAIRAKKEDDARTIDAVEVKPKELKPA